MMRSIFEKSFRMRPELKEASIHFSPFRTREPRAHVRPEPS